MYCIGTWSPREGAKGFRFAVQGSLPQYVGVAAWPKQVKKQAGCPPGQSTSPLF